MIMRDALNIRLQLYLHALHDCHLLMNHSHDGLLILFSCILFLWTCCVSHLSVLSLESFLFMWMVSFNARLRLPFICLQGKQWTVSTTESLSSSTCSFHGCIFWEIFYLILQFSCLQLFSMVLYIFMKHHIWLRTFQLWKICMFLDGTHR